MQNNIGRKNNMNEYTGIGNLTKDPTITESNEATYCNFTIAINNRNGYTAFVNVAAYNKQALACAEYLQKGSQVCVKGTPDATAWTDKDGNARASLKIKAREVEFLSKIKGKDKNMSNIDKAMQNSPGNSPSTSANSQSQPQR